jgi:uncharacterized protein involved in type VI secretion and phage assembly
MDDIITVSDLAGYPLHLRRMSGGDILGGHLEGMFEYRTDAGLPYFNEHVTSWSYRGERHDNAIYRTTVHPWLWMLNFTSACRISALVDPQTAEEGTICH